MWILPVRHGRQRDATRARDGDNGRRGRGHCPPRFTRLMGLVAMSDATGGRVLSFLPVRWVCVVRGLLRNRKRGL